MDAEEARRKKLDNFINSQKEASANFNPKAEDGYATTFFHGMSILYKAAKNGQDLNKFLEFNKEGKTFQNYFSNTVLGKGEAFRAYRSIFGKAGDNCPDGITPLFDAIGEFIRDYKDGKFRVKTLVPAGNSSNKIVEQSVKRGFYQQPLSARFNKYSQATAQAMNNIVKKEIEAKQGSAKQSPAAPKQ